MNPLTLIYNIQLPGGSTTYYDIATITTVLRYRYRIATITRYHYDHYYNIATIINRTISLDHFYALRYHYHHCYNCTISLPSLRYYDIATITRYHYDHYYNIAMITTTYHDPDPDAAAAGARAAAVRRARTCAAFSNHFSLHWYCTITRF